MQQKILKLILLQLKVCGVLLVAALSMALLLSFRAEKVYADIWQQLGISKERGLQNIEGSFMNGYFHYYGAEKAKNLVSGDRVIIAKDLMNYAKQQIGSDAFRAQYEKARKSAKPQEPTRKLPTKEEIRQQRIAETEQGIRNTEKTLKEVKPDMAKAIRPVLDVLQSNLKEYKNPNSNMIEMMWQGEKMNLESEVRRYQERLKKWEEEYPADYRQMVKRRLQEFVALAKTVDFNAELKQAGSRKRFVNPAYEGKADNWKMIFRAGKNVIDPAVAFAEQWIQELN